MVNILNEHQNEKQKIDHKQIELFAQFECFFINSRTLDDKQT